MIRAKFPLKKPGGAASLKLGISQLQHEEFHVLMLDNQHLTDQQLKVLRELAHAGYAVIVWTPEELGDANPRHVENRLIELGHQVIEDLQCNNES